jgi:predicted esterase
VDEARRGAQLGMAGICVDLPFRPPFPGALFCDDRDRVALLAAVAVLRDAVELADELPELDASRLGYVGLSVGATVGVQLRAEEPRIAAFALISAVARISEYSSFPDHPQTRQMVRHGTIDRYLEAMRAVDPITYATADTRMPVLLQFGEHDPLVPKSSADELSAALGGTAEARWYGGGHDLDLQAQDERLRWLAAQLGATP